MSFKITNGGALTTFQDLGRFGYMQSGFSQNGAMDANSAMLANLLVGNNIADTVLEITLMGPTIIMDDECIIAITGGNCTPLINNSPVPMNTAIKINSGEILRTPLVVNGCRSYIAVSGGFDVPLVMGSGSTNLKCNIGGLDGRKLEKGDVIELKQPKSNIPNFEFRTVPYTNYTNELSVRIVLGPQDFMFTETAISNLKSSVYTISQKSDRMGIRLVGKPIEPIDSCDIISDGIALGSIQVPASGQPIIMMSDRQTTGGYAKIATVISSDIPLLAQAKSDDKICFEIVTVEEAQRIYYEKQNERNKLIDKFEVK